MRAYLSSEPRRPGELVQRDVGKSVAQGGAECGQADNKGQSPRWVGPGGTPIEFNWCTQTARDTNTLFDVCLACVCFLALGQDICEVGLPP